MSTLSNFIRDLHESGRVVVPGEGTHFGLKPESKVQIEAEPETALLAALAEAAQSACRSAPGSPPEINLPATRWGFSTLFHVARCFSQRDLGPEVLARVFAEHGPAARDPATIFSVDLGLRHLPTIAAWAIASAADDPLIAHLRALGRAWPLSSVGIPETAAGDPEPILAHPSLLALYVDRIIAVGDASRCSDPRIRLAVAAALGEDQSPLLRKSPLSRTLLESSP